MNQLALNVTGEEQLRYLDFAQIVGEYADRTPSLLLARMLTSLRKGNGVMPRWLGLSHRGFAELLQRHLPHLEADEFGRYGEMLDPSRYDEHEELRALFISHQTDAVEDATAMADILTAGCMGEDHLWQDMGFWSRNDLSAFIGYAFAPLCAKNVYDMKWKKFFYKQLCDQEGVYTCRAPSCQVCADYSDCFGPE